MNTHIVPLVGWTVAAPGAVAQAVPAIDISNLPAGLNGEPAFVDAFVLRITFTDTQAGAIVVTHRDFGAILPQVQLRSAVYGDLIGTGLTGGDLYAWIAPYMGWGPDCYRGHLPSPAGIPAAGAAYTRTMDFVIPFKNYRLADPQDTSLPTVGFRGDTIQCVLGAAAAFGAGHTLTAVTCNPFAIISTRKERKVPSVAHWLQDTSTNAIMTTPGRPFGFVGLCSNLSSLGGPAAVSGYTAITVSRGDLYQGIGMTPEMVMGTFTKFACGTVQSGVLVDTVAGGGGVAGALDWPYYNGTAAFNLLGNALDANTLVLPVMWEEFGQKLSQISTSPESLKIETAGIAGTHRLLMRAYATQTAEFAGRMAGLYGLSNPVVRPKLLKPPRDPSRGVKANKISLIPYTLAE